MVYPGNGILFSIKKKKELSSHEKTWRKPKCMLLSEWSQCEKATYCMIPTVWHSGKGKTLETVKKSVVARTWWWWAGGWINRTQRIFRTMKILYMILLWWMYVIIHLSNPIECTAARVNCIVNYALWLIMVCQCRFILGFKKKKCHSCEWC